MLDGSLFLTKLTLIVSQYICIGLYIFEEFSEKTPITPVS